MVTLFLVFIITKGALTLYEGNTIGRGAARGHSTQDRTAAHTICRLNINNVWHAMNAIWIQFRRIARSFLIPSITTVKIV